jgi:hypothetical protein
MPSRGRWVLGQLLLATLPARAEWAAPLYSSPIAVVDRRIGSWPARAARRDPIRPWHVRAGLGSGEASLGFPIGQGTTRLAGLAGGRPSV